MTWVRTSVRHATGRHNPPRRLRNTLTGHRQPPVRMGTWSTRRIRGADRGHPPTGPHGGRHGRFGVRRAIAAPRLDPGPRGGPPGPERRGPGRRPARVDRGHDRCRCTPPRRPGDADIAALGAAEPEAIRSRLLGAVTDFAHAVRAVPEEAWDVEIDRTPGGPPSGPARCPGCGTARWRSTTPTSGWPTPHADWPPAFAVRLVEAMAKRDLTDPAHRARHRPGPDLAPRPEGPPAARPSAAPPPTWAGG